MNNRKGRKFIKPITFYLFNGIEFLICVFLFAKKKDTELVPKINLKKQNNDCRLCETFYKKPKKAYISIAYVNKSTVVIKINENGQPPPDPKLKQKKIDQIFLPYPIIF
jgi:hypothetical protein